MHTRNRALEERPGILRFTVSIGTRPVHAVLSDRVLHARYGELQSDASLLEIYRSNQPLIDSAVARRVASGAREPVKLRASDF